jgi:hypothetical protein
MPKQIRQAKDNSFKVIFGDNTLFTQFLHDFIPLDILKDVKPEDVTDVGERYLPLFQEARDSDTVKRVNIPGSPPLFVIAIVEHESDVNFRTPFKMLQYITLVLEKYEKEVDKQKPGASARKDFKYPPVLPVIFYDGKNTWTAEKNFRHRTALQEVFGKYIPSFEYELVDLHRYNPEDIARFNDALSFVLLIDQVDITKTDKERLLASIPAGYLENLSLRIPENLRKLIKDVVTVLLSHGKASEEEIGEVTELLERKEYPAMFDAIVKDMLKMREDKERAERQIQAVEQRAQRRIQAAEQQIAELERKLREANQGK